MDQHLKASDIESRFYLLDPTSHVRAGVVRNIGDEIIKRAVNRVIEEMTRAAWSFEWVPYNFRPAANTPGLLVVAGGNVIGPLSLRSHGAVWRPKMNGDLGVFLYGVGWWSYLDHVAPRSVERLRKSLSGNEVHIVRDDYTAEVLTKIGIRGVKASGCPTMLGHSALSRSIQSNGSVIVSLTSYRKDQVRDRAWIRRLQMQGYRLSLFPQGDGDAHYLRKILGKDASQITVLPRDLDLLTGYAIETGSFVIGTRLHLGMHCLQNGIPTRVLAIDNRAIELGKTFRHLPITADIEELTSDESYFYEPLEHFDRNYMKDTFSAFSQAR